MQLSSINTPSSIVNSNAPIAQQHQLIPVFLGDIGGKQVYVCDGRTLHSFLENGKQFIDWMKDRIEKYGFIENQDFAIASPKSEAKRGGHNRKDYYLSLDMAKELSMVENNAKGKEARRYFIEMEKKALAASPSAIMLPDFTDPAEAAEAWAQQFRLAKQEQQRANALEVTVEAQKQTIHTKNDLIRASNEASVKAGEILVREFVKSVDIIRDRGIGDKKFYQWMREQGLIMDNRQPYQEYVTRGYFTWKPTSEEINGEYRYTLRITPRGKVWLAAKYMAYLDSASINALHESAERRNGLLLTQGGAA